MKMKRLLRYTTNLLRTALLLGAMILVSTQTQAQTAEQLAALPNAFQTVTPTINDGQYYYIQFYFNGPISYLTDRGLNKRVWASDFLPSNNRLWTLVSSNDGDDTHFKLMSKEGNYIGYDKFEITSRRYGSINNFENAITFTLRPEQDGYNIFDVSNNGLPVRYQNNEWTDIPWGDDRQSNRNINLLRFVKLKSNTAFIIYYRDNTVYDSGTLNSNWNDIGPNHYMTYSMTDSPDNISSTLFTTTQQTVSSRKSVTGNTKESWNLRTAAAYHKDGLWTIEKTGDGDNFWIKKYGTNDYLTRIDAPRKDGYSASIYTLETGNRSTFVFSSPENNRYSSIRNVNNGTYLNYADGDGWYVLDWNDPDVANTWQAGFLPVEVPSPNQDDSYGVLLKVKRTDNRIQLTGQTNNPTIAPLEGSTLDNLYGATFTPTANFTNVFQFKNMPTGCYTKIVIRFGSPVPDRWHLHTYGGQFDNNVNLSGLTEYEVNLNGNPITDFTIFNWDTMEPITITECYFYPENPDCDLVEMLNHDGGTDVYSEQAGVRKLWHLEQVDDYGHFRLKNPNGKYFQADGVVTNDENNAKIFTNTSLLEKFDVKWYYFDPAVKEIPVNHKITHKTSYLQQYAQAELDKQGLATDADSDWKNANGTQKVNLFEITHYVERGKSLTVEFPTVLNYNNDHVYYQRFYHFNDETCDNDVYPDGTDINGLKNHVSLDVAGIGDVQYYLYLNGMVTGEKLNWDGIDQGSFTRKALRSFKFTNSDGKNFTMAADVSRYSDFTYENPYAPQTGDLKEPSLTMRYLYYMKDAKVMAKALTGYPEQDGVKDKTVWQEEDAEDGTVCTTESKWYEKKIFHFPATPLPYENDKWAGYRGEFIGLRHVFSDYWVFNDGNPNSEDDTNLVSAVNDVYGGKIEVRIYDPNKTGIRLGGWNPNIDPKGTVEGDDDDYQGFYFYDKVARNQKTQYGDSRFIVFRYPKDDDGKATTVTNTGKEAYIHVYLNNNGTRYQLAQFTVIFDENSDTRPWTSVNNSAEVQGTDRDPVRLREIAGRPIAKITFDYPVGETYHYPASTADDPLTRHDGVDDRYGTISNSSPIPLKFDNTNYAFDGDGCNWGSYAMVTTKNTQWGNGKTASPANDATYGYDIDPDDNLQSAFLYIDASEQPGDICSADFQGEFCAGDKLMCSGWISGSNRYSDNGEYRCPGGITLTVKGERIEDGEKETIYRFCPGQCYELDNGTGVDGSTDATHVVWQQFYFEFGTTQKYKRYWMEVNNNCVSSNGGDFMLDNVEVFALVPEVKPEMNTPLCINKDVNEMKLLKINVGFDKILAATKENELTGDASKDMTISFVFLEKDKFLTRFLEELNKDPLNLGIANVGALKDIIEKGDLGDKITPSQTNYFAAYKAAFNAAKLGDLTKIWDSNNREVNTDAAVLNFHWNTNYSKMEAYSFEKAVNRSGVVFCETDTESGERSIVMNGNYPNKLPWKMDTDYYIVPYNAAITSITDALYEDFNICSACCKKAEFQIKPSIQILSMESSDVTEELVVCEGKIPTLLTNLTGYDIKGNEVKMKNLNFDWWLGNKTADEPEDRLATLDNYHKQYKLIDEAGEDVEENRIYLAYALSIMRAYYPGITSLDGVTTREEKAVHLEDYMINYLREVVDKGELLLHQSAISVPAEKVLDSDPYFYLVACPIHDEAFNQALNPSDNEYVAFYCDEPQGVRIKLGQKAPRLQTGFVPGEHGFTEYHYDFPANTTPVLSIRLARAAQFETVKELTAATDGNIRTDVNYLWLPIRNAQTEGADGVIKKSQDDNIYLASSNDLTWDKKISKEMNKNGLLPIVGRIVQLQAVNTKNNSSANENANNRLCVYFNKDFNVREGYNYTLSLPFQEELDGEGNSQNACDGTILINLKIVPDYEVWTGAAGNTDWNNDENWRRADGNTTISNDVYGDELYRANGAVDDNESPLHNYTTNKNNYYSSSKKASAKPSSDQVLRKGFAPLYCTHILMKSDEWGNAPVLYDAIDGHDEETNGSRLISSPFPNLRDTSTPILKFDMQARRWNMWEDTYGVAPDRGSDSRPNDLIAEMYQINSCDEIAMQPGTELRNAELLNYNSAWMEFELDAKRWYLLGSPLQGTISGEWYAPTATEKMGNVPQQRTTYYDDVTFGEGYDRYSPAIYQRSWDKAKAVLYEVGSDYDETDDEQTNDDDVASQGQWGDTDWNTAGADDYLDRLGYKPFGEKKANVAIKGIWSNTYNDAQVDYGVGGFSVMVMNHLKGKAADVKAIVRLPKEDTKYDYYKYSEDGSDDGGTDTEISKVQTKDRTDNTKRATNRGRLKSDLLLPTQDGIRKLEKEVDVDAGETYRYGDRRWITRIPTKEADLITMNSGTFSFTETVAAGASDLGYYLVENPFPCGLDMNKFFKENGYSEQDNPDGVLQKKYWLLTKTDDGQEPRQVLVQQAPDSEWVTSDGTNAGTAIDYYPDPKDAETTSSFYPQAVLAPGQGFFVQAKTGVSGDLTVTFNKDMQAQSRFGVIKGKGKTYKIVVGQAQVMQKMYDSDGDGMPDIVFLYDSDGDGKLDKIPDDLITAGNIWIDTDDDGAPDRVIRDTDFEYEGEMIWVKTGDDSFDVKNVLTEIVYETDEVTGEEVPKLMDIEEDVVIYKYVQETLTTTPDNPETTEEDESETTEKEHPLLARTRGEAAMSLPGLVITAKRGADETSALVMQREGASNDFLPSEDTETFITSDFESVPTVYTLCGRLATTINSIHDFRCLPIGVESNSDAPCVLTFQGVETLGDSVAFYDAVKQILTPLKSGMQVSVSGQTQNRYYLVRSLIKEEAAEETHLQIFNKGMEVTVIASTQEPLTSVRCFDTAGRQIYSVSPQAAEYCFTLPSNGIYIIDAQTESDRKSKKIISK